MTERKQPSPSSAAAQSPLIEYHPTAFTQGRMDFSWEALSEEERRQAYADWEAGKGLIGGDPRKRPNSDRLPEWGLNRPYFRTLALDDTRGDNGARLRDQIASERPLEVEIGFGRGDFILDRARRHPDTLFIGYETKIRATRLLLQRVERFSLDNLWVSDDDARFSLPRVLPQGRADAVHILFPDPWWKESYRIKRLFSPPFVDLLGKVLRPGGLIHFKSDVEEYGELVRYLVEGHPDFTPHGPTLATRIGDAAPTHREAWCIRHARPVYAYHFARV